MENMKYSIVIPCYNSGKTISKVVLLTMQEMKGKEIEFILVNYTEMEQFQQESGKSRQIRQCNCSEKGDSYHYGKNIQRQKSNLQGYSEKIMKLSGAPEELFWRVLNTGIAIFLNRSLQQV